MNRFVGQKLFYVASAALTTASATGIYLYKSPVALAVMSQESQGLHSYNATFSVPITCDSCTSDVSRALSPLPKIDSINYDIPSKLVHITSSQPPSVIITAIQSTGRTAILRGSGKPNTAAVCILETPWKRGGEEGKSVRGLVRLIEVDKGVTMVDVTLTGMSEGRYGASVRTGGDISDGKRGIGDSFRGLQNDKVGDLGQIIVDGQGKGSLVGEIGWSIWEMVGRGLLVEKKGGQEEEEAVMGVVARSAGVWENDKSVCSCTGKTLWEEREQMVEKGIS